MRWQHRIALASAWLTAAAGLACGGSDAANGAGAAGGGTPGATGSSSAGGGRASSSSTSHHAASSTSTGVVTSAGGGVGATGGASAGAGGAGASSGTGGSAGSGGGWESQLYPRSAGAFTRPVVTFGGRSFQLPDFSYAGYRLGAAALGEGVPCATRAIAGTGDITAELQAAVEALGGAAGGTVSIPAGSFTLSAPVFVGYDDVSIVGAGSDATILHIGADWSPPTALTSGGDGVFVLGAKSDADYRKSWLYKGNRLTTATAPVAEGATTIAVAGVAGLAVGQFVLVQQYFWPAFVAVNGTGSTWQSIGPGADVTFTNGNPNISRESSFAYLREITAVDAAGKTLTLDAPIPYALDPANNVIAVRSTTDGRDINAGTFSNVRNVGLAGVSIVFADRTGGELGTASCAVGPTMGMSPSDAQTACAPTGAGVQFHGVRDGWAYDVAVHDIPHFGFLVDSSARVTVRDAAVYGGQNFVGGWAYGFNTDSSQNVLWDHDYGEFTRHNHTARTALASVVVHTHGEMSMTHLQGTDMHYQSSHEFLWDDELLSYGANLEASWRGTASSNAQEADLSSVVWNLRDDGQRGPFGGGLIAMNPSSSGYAIVVYGSTSYAVVDGQPAPPDATHPLGVVVPPTPSAPTLQVMPSNDAPGLGSRDQNVLYEGIGYAGLSPRSLYAAELAERLGASGPSEPFSSACRAAPSPITFHPSTYTGPGTLVFDGEHRSWSLAFGSNCGQNEEMGIPATAARSSWRDTTRATSAPYSIAATPVDTVKYHIMLQLRGPSVSAARFTNLQLEVYPTTNLALLITLEHSAPAPDENDSVTVGNGLTVTGLAKGTWNHVSLPLDGAGSFGAAGGDFDTIRVATAGASGDLPGTVSIDDVLLSP